MSKTSHDRGEWVKANRRPPSRGSDRRRVREVVRLAHDAEGRRKVGREREGHEALRQGRAVDAPQVPADVEVRVHGAQVLGHVRREERVVGAHVALSRERRHAHLGGKGERRHPRRLVDEMKLRADDHVVEEVLRREPRRRGEAVASHLQLDPRLEGQLREKRERPLARRRAACPAPRLRNSAPASKSNVPGGTMSAVQAIVGRHGSVLSRASGVSAARAGKGDASEPTRLTSAPRRRPMAAAPHARATRLGGATRERRPIAESGRTAAPVRRW